MNSWTPLWNTIVESSVWELPDWVCKIWITLMALKDPDHVVRKTAYQIAHYARKTEAEVLKALDILSKPDKARIEPQAFEGRRIERVEDGWLVLNGQKYQELMQLMIRARQQAQWQREKRMIDRAVENGESLDPATLSPALKARYEKAKEKEKRRRMKLVTRDGEKAGAREAVNRGLDEAQAKVDRENAEAERLAVEDHPPGMPEEITGSEV